MKRLPLVLLLFACAHAEVGERRVIEHDVGDWSYRRFQKVEDIELPMEGNPGVGWTAVYQKAETVGRASVPRSAMAVAFVTEYERADKLAAGLEDKLGKLKDYKVKKDKIGGRAVWVAQGDGDTWVFWASGRYIVKVGGPETRDIPKQLVEEYLDIYR